METREIKIQGLLDRYLKANFGGFSAAAEAQHLDADTLAAFVEGSLVNSQSTSAISHLVDCSFCRHVSAELIQLDMEFADSEAAAPTALSGEPMKISEVLNGLFSRIFGTSDGAVFAHGEKEQDVTEEGSDTEASTKKD